MHKTLSSWGLHSSGMLHSVLGWPVSPTLRVKQGHSGTAWPLKMGLMNHPKTPLIYHQPTLPKILEQWRAQLHAGESLWSVIWILLLHTVKLKTHVARQNEISSSICVTVLNQVTVIAEWQAFRLIEVWLLFYGSIWFSWKMWNCFIYTRKLSSWYSNRKLFALPNSSNQSHMDNWISVFSSIFLLNKSYFQKLREKKCVQHLWIYYYTFTVNVSIFHLVLKVIPLFIINMWRML